MSTPKVVAGPPLRKRLWKASLVARRRAGQATASFRPLPEFLVVGAQRAGTTSLYRYLLQHPGVISTRLTKGVHWFDEHFDEPVSWYRGHFPTTLQRRQVGRRIGYPPVTGEASPYYLFHPHVPSRIAAAVPDASIIAILRDPVERAWSHYQHNVARSMEPLSFADALAAEPDRLAGAEERLRRPGFVDLRHRRGSYVARGRYLEQLERVWSVIRPDKALVLFTDELDRDPIATLARVHTFLGLVPVAPTITRRWNEQPRADLPPGTRDFLEAAFADPDRLLAERLGAALPWTNSAR